MALQMITVTLGATATRVRSTPLFATAVRIENDAGNALVKFGDLGLVTDAYAGSVPADTATDSNAVTLGPFFAALVDVSLLYLLGTVGQKVRVAVIVP